MSRIAANLSSTKIYGLGTYLTHWRIYWIHSQRHFYGRASEEPNQPGVLRAHGKCRDNSRLVYPVNGSLYPAKLGFKCRSPRWVLPHQVKARLVGKRGMENEVRHCLRLLFSVTGHHKKKRVQWSWVRERVCNRSLTSLSRGEGGYGRKGSSSPWLSPSTSKFSIPLSTVNTVTTGDIVRASS